MVITVFAVYLRRAEGERRCFAVLTSRLKEFFMKLSDLNDLDFDYLIITLKGQKNCLGNPGDACRTIWSEYGKDYSFLCVR